MMKDKYKGYDIRLGRPFLNPIEKMGRTVLRFSPHIRIRKPHGISALTLLRDEPMAYESISSILPMVDEVVVVDSSKRKAKIPVSDKIIYVYTPPEQDVQSKIGVLLCKYQWILRWDGDFLSTDETEGFLEYVRSIKEGYWQIKCMVANIDKGEIDFLQKEQYVFSYHPELLTANYKPLKYFTDVIAKLRGGMAGRIFYGMLPYFYGQIDKDVVFAEHHYKYKSTQRLKERLYQAEWSLLTDIQRSMFKGFEDFVIQEGGGFVEKKS